MLLVKTYLAQSQIEGLGLFADEDIPMGTHVWNFDAKIDLAVEADFIEELSLAAKEYFEKYAYLDVKLKKYVVCGDDARFVNHSDAPNLVETYVVGQEHGVDRASRDIKKGEELTCDYRAFDSDFGIKLKFLELGI
jgi:uncharacterized protein